MAKEKICKRCGAKFIAMGREVFCSDACKAAARRDSSRASARRAKCRIFGDVTVTALRRTAMKELSLSYKETLDVDSYTIQKMLERAEEKRKRDERLRALDAKYEDVPRQVTVYGGVIREIRGRNAGGGSETPFIEGDMLDGESAGMGLMESEEIGTALLDSFNEEEEL